MLNVDFKPEGIKKSEPKILGKSITGSFVVLLLVACFYATLIFAGKILSSKIETAKNQNEADYKNFLAGNGNDVIDFKNRNLAAQNAISQSRPAGDILTQIESSILPAVYLESLKYNSKNESVSLKCVGDNFNTEAKQILSFKESGFYSSVTPSSGEFDSANGKLNFSIDLKLKTK